MAKKLTKQYNRQRQVCLSELLVSVAKVHVILSRVGTFFRRR